MNILFVHEIDWSNKVVFDMYSLSELLSSFGHNVFMIDFPSLHNRNGLLDFGSLKTKIFENVAGRAHNNASVTIIRPGYIKAPFLDRASAFVTHYFTINRAIKQYQINAIVLYSVPTNGLQTLKLAKKHGIPVVFRSIDILHKLVPHNIFSPFTFLLETWVYNHVNKILTISPKLSEYVMRMNANKDSIELLPIGVDLNKFNPYINSEKLKEILGLSEHDRVVLFIGTLFEFSGLDFYVKQFPKVVEAIPEVKLVIVGGGALLDKLTRLVATLDLKKNVVLTGFKPFSMMPQFINLADLCINPFLINPTTREIIPGKIIQYLACGKPVLATPLPGMVSLLSGPEYGVVYSDIDRFAENTMELLKDNKLARTIGENGYQYVKNNHDEQKIAHRLCTVLDQIVNKHFLEN